MMLSIPARCRRCDSISPAGPAPTIPTCVRSWVRMSFPGFFFRYVRSRGRTDSGKGTIAGSAGIFPDSGARLGSKPRRPAITRHPRHVVAVRVAELRFEIALLAQDQTDDEENPAEKKPLVEGQKDTQEIARHQPIQQQTEQQSREWNKRRKNENTRIVAFRHCHFTA